MANDHKSIVRKLQIDLLKDNNDTSAMMKNSLTKARSMDEDVLSNIPSNKKRLYVLFSVIRDKAFNSDMLNTLEKKQLIHIIAILLEVTPMDYQFAIKEFIPNVLALEKIIDDCDKEKIQALGEIQSHYVNKFSGIE